MKRLELLLFWTFSTLVLFAVIEGAASWALGVRAVVSSPPRDLHTQYDSLLGWSSVPGIVIESAYGPGTTIAINESGFRGGPTRERPTETPRVICSGDSFTFGQGVGNGDDWCHQMARLSDIEPVNLGQPGFGIDQAYLWYERDGLQLSANIHLFAFVADDFRRMLTAVRYGAGKPVFRTVGDSLILENVPVPKLTHAIGRVVDRLDLRIVRLGLGAVRHRGQSPATLTESQEERRTEPLARASFSRLYQMNLRSGAQTVLVYLPTQVELRRVDFRRQMTRSIAAELGVTFIDLTPALLALSAHEAAEMFLPDGHYSVDGNRWVADRLTEELRAEPDLATHLQPM